MFSKNAPSDESAHGGGGEKAVFVSPHPRFLSLLKTPSITRKLTLLYLASTVVLLALAAGFLYWTLKRSLAHTRHALLASKVEVLRNLLQQPGKAAVLADEVEHEASESQPRPRIPPRRRSRSPSGTSGGRTTIQVVVLGVASSVTWVQRACNLRPSSRSSCRSGSCTRAGPPCPAASWD